jgi:DNA polymerase III sliding clamp (beta) subunit (PCNA family)
LRVSGTDRYRLLIGEVKAPEEDLIDQIIIPLPDIKKILTSIKALPKRGGETIILSRYGDLLKVLIGSDTLSVDLITGNFPPVDHLFTDDKGAVTTLQLNADYLASFAKVPTNGGGQTFTFTGDRKPIRVKINHDLITWRGLLMPMRTN